jgi:hypothetical protein
MADNFPLTVGSGRNIATDEVSYSGDTADVQVVRLANVAGSEGSRTVEEALVKTAPNMKRIAVTSGGLTIATTAYTAGDQVGTQFTIANAARASGGFGYIVGVTLTDVADIIGAYDVVFTRSSITLASDNAAYAISDTHLLEVVALVQLNGAYDIGNNRISQATNIRIPFDCSGGTSLYAGLITRSAHTFFTATTGATDLQLVVYIEQGNA